MDGSSDLPGRVTGGVRRWGAELCLAETGDQVARVLSAALLELGFESVDALKRGGPGGVTLCWSSLGGIGVPADDPFVAARHHVLSRLDPSVHQWVARQSRVICQDDFLALHKPIYTEFLHLPQDFGHAPWRTKLSIPYVGDNRGLSIGLASMAPYEVLRGRLPDVRFLVQLYCVLTGEDDCEREAVEERASADLNPKQIECLRWAAAGKTYGEIAEIVGISERTVRYHLEGARTQFGFATIMQTIVQAAKEHHFDPLDAR